MNCELKEVCFKYEKENILKNINMEINHGDFISIIGPSGSGKTTLLKILAGILPDFTGEIDFSSELSLENSRVIVFQDYLLFPHMTIFNNIAFGLKARKISKKEITYKVLKYLEYFGLSDKKDFLPEELSAGQKQRVAIARAMVIEPKLLLLDEPFANLDYNLKLETAEFIKKTQKHFNITTICVTHDQKEAFYISDKIGILLNGELLEFNNVKDILLNPKTLKSAEFIGHLNYIPKEYTTIFLGTLPFKDLYVKPYNMLLTHNPKGNFLITKISYSNELITYNLKNKDLELSVTSFLDDFKIGELVLLELNNYILKENLC